MELIIIIVAIIATLVVQFLMKYNLKELKQIANDSELNKIAENYPDNMQICKTLLKELDNENVKIEESQDSDSILYIAISNKIVIGNTHGSFSRIQTMAHECLHSIQDKKMLIFNFIYSNIYFIYFAIISILVILKKLPNEMLFSNILLILSFIYYVLRSFLENDAMIKAEFLAKEYINSQKISSKEEIYKINKGFEKINKNGIKGVNCSLFTNIMIKVIIFNALALIF